MIPSALYRDPVLLQADLHRHKKLARLSDFSIAAAMHAVFLAAAEFPEAALEYPIIFLSLGEKDAAGREGVTACAMLGVTRGENLYVQGQKWDATYLPAFIRRFPFLLTKTPNQGATSVAIDQAWAGFGDTKGEALFTETGEPAAALQRMLKFLEQFEQESRRTEALCALLVELDLLKTMQVDATLPSGEALHVDGFLAVDEDKLAKLDDAQVLVLHRNGALRLISAHLVSLNNLRRLVHRKAARVTAA